MSTLALLRLLQLASQALPVGGFSHSHGLEAAIDAGIVRDEPTLARWLADMLDYSLGSFEAQSLLDCHEAWQRADHEAAADINQEFLATRESAELRAATVQMGYSMRRLLAQMPGADLCVAALDACAEPTLPYVFAAVANHWQVTAADSLTAYLWSWVENQVLVALKAVPLGQSAGQRVLFATAPLIAAIVERPADSRPRSTFAPALAILSSRHETQYSRLFRS